jgi:peptide chain release factor subunit 1
MSANEHPVVTCYLKVEPRDRARGKYLTKMKNRARDVAEGLTQLGYDRASQEAIGRDMERIHEFLRNPGNLPSAQGLAIFASEGQGLFEVVPLPGVYRSRLSVDRTPLVRELAAVEDEFGRIMTVAVDRTSARFFEVTAYGAEEVLGVRADALRTSRFRGDQAGGPGGWGEHTFHNRIREDKQRHYDAVARQLFSMDRRAPFHGLVLGGTGVEAKGLEPFLHPYLAERVIGSAKLNPKATTPAEVHEITLEVRREWEREQERRAIAEMREKLGTGWAANGIEPTLKALSRGQVRVLLVRADASQSGYRCSDTGRLTLLERDCKLEGTPIPVLDLVDDAIEEALGQDVEVNVVYEEAAAEEIDGLAALFRFR